MILLEKDIADCNRLVGIKFVSLYGQVNDCVSQKKPDTFQEVDAFFDFVHEVQGERRGSFANLMARCSPKPFRRRKVEMSENSNDLNIARQVPLAQPDPNQSSDANELAQLSIMIRTWREIQREADELNSQIKEKKKRSKVMEEMILRVMKKHNIGALDLQSSGGRILYRRQTSKAGLSQKEMARLLAEHMKSEQAANTALQYISEHRGSKVKESLLYEKE
jgi:hypothetical protein